MWKSFLCIWFAVIAVIVLAAEFIDGTFDNHFLNIYVKAQQADETKILKKCLIIFREIGKGLLGYRVFFANIL